MKLYTSVQISKVHKYVIFLSIHVPTIRFHRLRKVKFCGSSMIPCIGCIKLSLYGVTTVNNRLLVNTIVVIYKYNVRQWECMFTT
jgi:hypothetical protein